MSQSPEPPPVPSPLRPAERGCAVVTGGTAGVGRAVVRRLADAGFDVAVLARGRAGLDATAGEVRDRGRRCLTLQVDVADAEALDAAAERVEAELGPITAWVNNAFVGSLGWFDEGSVEEFRRITEVTYLGQVNGTRAALRHMGPRDAGSIVNVSSALAHRAIALQAAYCGAKHAVKGFTESVRTELRARHSAVSLSMVTLPGVNTPQFTWNLLRMPQRPAPVPPLVTPEVAARTIVFTVLHPRHDRWVGRGAVLNVVAGRLAPVLMDRYLARTVVAGQQTPRDFLRVEHNLYEARDETDDHGSDGPFTDSAASWDVVSRVGDVATLARAVVRDAVLGAVGSVATARRLVPGTPAAPAGPATPTEEASASSAR